MNVYMLKKIPISFKVNGSIWQQRIEVAIEHAVNIDYDVSYACAVKQGSMNNLDTVI
jgi:hypothetical protein